MLLEIMNTVITRACRHTQSHRNMNTQLFTYTYMHEQCCINVQCRNSVYNFGLFVVLHSNICLIPLIQKTPEVCCTNIQLTFIQCECQSAHWMHLCTNRTHLFIIFGQSSNEKSTKNDPLVSFEQIEPQAST